MEQLFFLRLTGTERSVIQRPGWKQTEKSLCSISVTISILSISFSITHILLYFRKTQLQPLKTFHFFFLPLNFNTHFCYFQISYQLLVLQNEIKNEILYSFSRL